MTESSKLSLLQATLSVAVPLRIAELRHKPLAEILAPEALSYIQTRLGEAREEVLYGGKYCADGFNALADGLARLAFLPGGVTVLGMHFDADADARAGLSEPTPTGPADADARQAGQNSLYAGRP